METIKIKISEVKLNPNNPRLIKDDNFKKLVQSIKDFPEMLNIRPVVVNKDMVVLGGNMRLKACIEAGMGEIPVIIADLSEEKQKEFLIKDNISGGEWDWDILADEWDDLKLMEWGLDIPGFGMGSEFSEVEGYGFMNKVTIEFKTFEEAQAYHIKCTNENLKARLS